MATINDIMRSFNLREKYGSLLDIMPELANITGGAVSPEDVSPKAILENENPEKSKKKKREPVWTEHDFNREHRLDHILGLEDWGSEENVQNLMNDYLYGTKAPYRFGNPYTTAPITPTVNRNIFNEPALPEKLKQAYSSLTLPSEDITPTSENLMATPTTTPIEEEVVDDRTASQRRLDRRFDKHYEREELADLRRNSEYNRRADMIKRSLDDDIYNLREDEGVRAMAEAIKGLNVGRQTELPYKLGLLRNKYQGEEDALRTEADIELDQLGGDVINEERERLSTERLESETRKQGVPRVDPSELHNKYRDTASPEQRRASNLLDQIAEQNLKDRRFMRGVGAAKALDSASSLLHNLFEGDGLAPVESVNLVSPEVRYDDTLREKMAGEATKMSQAAQMNAMKMGAGGIIPAIQSSAMRSVNEGNIQAQAQLNQIQQQNAMWGADTANKEQEFYVRQRDKIINDALQKNMIRSAMIGQSKADLWKDLERMKQQDQLYKEADFISKMAREAASDPNGLADRYMKSLPGYYNITGVSDKDKDKEWWEAFKRMMGGN